MGGPYNKDYSILGSILGSSYLGKLPNGVQRVSWFHLRITALRAIDLVAFLLNRNPKT